MSLPDTAFAAETAAGIALTTFRITHATVFAELARLEAAVEDAHAETRHFRHCACREECEAWWDDRKPIPAGWKVAHCPCGNPMNAYGDISINAPAALCPAHPVPEISKRWVCAYCHNDTHKILITDATKLGDDGFVHL